MKAFFKGRCGGKTTAMIYTSAVTGTPILCACQRSGALISQRARELGLSIPDPVFVTGENRGRRIATVLIDDAERVLEELVRRQLGAEITAFAMTVPPSEQEGAGRK